MPRNTALRVVPYISLENIVSTRPLLWSAHRRIKSGKVAGGQPTPQQIRDPKAWNMIVSDDVAEYIEKAKLSSKQRYLCLSNPAEYFSRPANVPPEFRKQVYFPNFRINLMRTPHLPPKYAAFDVPLWFNKLDMKDYLRSAYNVDVIHIRSTVTQAKVQRTNTTSPYAQGRLYRPQSTKKMTVELVEPFIWPESVENLEAWEKDSFYESQKYAIDLNESQADSAAYKPNVKERKSIKEQAREVLAGKAVWKPTWQSIPKDAKALQLSDPRQIGHRLQQRNDPHEAV